MSNRSNKYIVRQPIKNQKDQVVGYEILYYGENEAYDDRPSVNESIDFIAADTIYHFMLQNSGKALSGSFNFMTFTPSLLKKKTPHLFDRSDLVIQIDDSVIIHPAAMQLVEQFNKEGYKIAVNDFQFAPRYLAILDSIDYIKINFQTLADHTLHNIIEIAHGMNKCCVAVGVDDEDAYRKAKEMNVDLLEGSYVAEKLAIHSHTIGYLQSNFFRLMVAVTKEDANIDEIEKLISIDATLTYGILRMVNSCYFALRQRASTVKQAIMTMGLNQLKQWIYLLSASNADNQFDADSEEFLKLSFMRANFCSALMAYAKQVPLKKNDAYLMGMFSTLNYLIDAPLADILNEVPIVDESRRALLSHEGRAGLLYDLALSYERADWNAITSLASQLEIPSKQLTIIYFNCIEEVNQVWSQLTNPNPDLNDEPDPREALAAEFDAESENETADSIPV